MTDTTLASYDDLPYDSVPITDTHPDGLRAIARLFGVNARPAGQCRVLELGCAGGGNLIPMAFYLPGSSFVGIDLARQHVDEANALIAELGLNNVRVLHRSVTDDLSDLGEFDYIVAHGLYSWVPRVVQDKVLAVCGRQLAQHGIAYVSYNTLPGWHARAPLRDMLLAFCDKRARASVRLNEAHALFDLLAPALQLQDTPEARGLLAEIEYLRRAPASYLYHEYLEETNEPLWFSEFMARADAAGLAYLADAVLSTMLPATLGDATARALSGLNDRIRVEQLMDYARLRKFRRTLLVRREVAVNVAPDLDAFEALAFHADLNTDEEIDLASDRPQSFRLASGGECRIAHPLAKAAAMTLALRYPSALGWYPLLAAASALVAEHGDEKFIGEVAAFKTEWFSLVAYQSVRIAAEARTYPVDLPERPAAHALARAQAKRGRVLASVRHAAVELDEFGALLVRQLDGTRALDELVDWLLAELQRLGHAPARAALRPACQQLLWTLGRAGLLA
ncbi:methyltransferase family protein [Sulfuritortus calidifontis]|uniref:Methyltransferase family protein n=1 Tax=Sulfuritortus calidifontis TaxID=1914471 RepID=A0A4V2UQX8_9PROT|nr:methyltransferase regulatory domain-containing protein [Sulfuritortus calidifontis]TCS73236.1 methyltransferase family protein [Sulfuritortus calidifontis]